MFNSKLPLLAAAVATLITLSLASAQVPMTGGGKGTSAAPASTPMITPVLAKAAGTSNFPSNSATSYGSIVGGELNSGFNTTRLARTVPFPIAGSFGNLKVYFPTVLSQGSYAVNMNINNSAASFTCTIDTTHQTCTDDVTTAAVAAGQLVTIQVVPTGTPTAQSVPPQISLEFTSTNNNESFICSGTTGNSVNSAQNWLSFGGFTSWTTTEVNASSIIPVGGVLDQFYVSFGTAIATGTYTISVYQNGSNSALTTAALSSGTSGNDLVHSLAVTALDTLSLSEVPASTPTASGITACARWVPTTANQALVLASWTTVPPTTTNAIRFGNLAGAFQNGSAQANPNNIIPSFPASFTLSKFVAAQSTATGAGATRAFAVLQGTPGGTINTDCGFSSTITNGVTLTIGGVSTPAVQDGSTTCALTAGNSADVKVTNSATTPAAVTWVKYSAVAVVQ